MKIPSDNRWVQTNNGDILGVLNDSYQMNYDKSGYARASKKPFALYSSDTDANFAYLMALVYFDSSYVAVTTDKVYQLDLSGGTVTEQAAFVPSTTLSSDALVYQDAGGTDQLIVTIDNNFCRWNGSASVSYTLGSLTSGVPHPLCIFESKPTYDLAIGDGNKVNLYDGSWNKSSTVLTLPTEYQVTTLAYRNGYLFVGTKNIYGGEARIFVWNGDSANADYDIAVGGSWVFSMTPYLSTVAAVVDTGVVGVITGNTYEVVGTLPIYHHPNFIWQGAGGLQLNGRVFHRGMTAVGKNLYINVDGRTETGELPTMRSGLWIFDPDVGLYHAASNTSNEYVSDNGLSVTSSVITTSTTHNLKTGDAVQFKTVSGLSGVDTGVPYFVSAESTTTIKLAKTRKALQAGKYVSITGTAGLSDVLLYVPNTEYAGDRNASSGALLAVSPKDSPLEFWSYPVIWGSRSDKADNTAFYGLYTLSDSWNIGRFTTQRIYTPNIKQVWQTVASYFNGIGVSTEKLIVKYKNDDSYGYPTRVLQGVWLSTNEINSTSTQDEDEWSDIEIGDEVTIVDGTGRGYTAHVSETPTSSSSVYTITLDESVGVANDDVFIVVDKFRKIQTADLNRADTGQAIMEIGTKSTWLQLKVEMRGFETEFSMFDLINSVDQSAR